MALMTPCHRRREELDRCCIDNHAASRSTARHREDVEYHDDR
jgi:hypothetical protein